MRIVCWQTILMKYHALFVIFEKSSKIWNGCLLQIIGGALWVEEIKRRKSYSFKNYARLNILPKGLLWTVNSLPASVKFCRVLMLFENSLDPDQA